MVLMVLDVDIPFHGYDDKKKNYLGPSTYGWGQDVSKKKKFFSRTIIFFYKLYTYYYIYL